MFAFICPKLITMMWLRYENWLPFICLCVKPLIHIMVVFSFPLFILWWYSNAKAIISVWLFSTNMQRLIFIKRMHFVSHWRSLNRMVSILFFAHVYWLTHLNSSKYRLQIVYVGFSNCKRCHHAIYQLKVEWKCATSIPHRHMHRGRKLCPIWTLKYIDTHWHTFLSLDHPSVCWPFQLFSLNDKP